MEQAIWVLVIVSTFSCPDELNAIEYPKNYLFDSQDKCSEAMQEILNNNEDFDNRECRKLVCYKQN